MNMTFPFLNLPERVIIRVVQIAVSSIHRRRLIRIQVFRVWKDQTLINYIDKKWRKDYPNSYEDGNRHRSILSRAKWLCLYGVLYDAALNCLVGTFGRHGISEDEIREWWATTTTPIVRILVSQGWICMGRGIRELHTGIRS